jgi:outer membrane receptor protein involved in Fe transport
MRRNIPENFASVDVQWRGEILGHRAGIGISNIYNGKLRYNNYDYGNYWLTDLNVFFDINKNHRFALQLNNLFDKNYESFAWSQKNYTYGVIGTPFTLTATYTFRFNQSE